MKEKKTIDEYNAIVEDILNNDNFYELKKLKHHSTNRLDHSKRVSINSYKLCKILNLDYKSAARGALLHDFFVDKYTNHDNMNLLLNHPHIASTNSEKYFTLNNKEKNIIESHMYPLNINIRPKYPESIIVNIVDKVSSIYEKTSFYLKKIL